MSLYIFIYMWYMCVFLHAVITKHKKQRASLLLPLAVRKTECVCRPEWRRSPAANYSSGGKKGQSNGESSASSANEPENGSIKNLLRWMKVIGSLSHFLLLPDQTKQRPLYFCFKGEIITRAFSEGKTAPKDVLDPVRPELWSNTHTFWEEVHMCAVASGMKGSVFICGSW